MLSCLNYQGETPTKKSSGTPHRYSDSIGSSPSQQSTPHSPKQALGPLKQFLHSPDCPLEPAEYHRVEWGFPPFDQYIENLNVLGMQLLAEPSQLDERILILEPWPTSGNLPTTNNTASTVSSDGSSGEPIRASINTAYILHQTGHIDSLCWPLWKTGICSEALSLFSHPFLAIIVEGGSPRVYEPNDWTASGGKLNYSHKAAFQTVEALLFARRRVMCPQFFVCMGHQLAFRCLVAMLRRALMDIQEAAAKPKKSAIPTQQLQTLVQIAKKVEAVGAGTTIPCGNRKIQGWKDSMFAVGPSEQKKCVQLVAYKPSQRVTGSLPAEVLEAHAETSNNHTGFAVNGFSDKVKAGHTPLHKDEVNEEAALIVNWGLASIHKAIKPYADIIGQTSLSRLLDLPCGISIVGSGVHSDNTQTAVAATCLHYRNNFGTKQRSYTFHYHPAVIDGWGQFGEGPRGSSSPSLMELYNEPNIRNLLQPLYSEIQIAGTF